MKCPLTFRCLDAQRTFISGWTNFSEGEMLEYAIRDIARVVKLSEESNEFRFDHEFGEWESVKERRLRVLGHE